MVFRHVKIVSLNSVGRVYCGRYCYQVTYNKSSYKLFLTTSVGEVMPSLILPLTLLAMTFRKTRFPNFLGGFGLGFNPCPYPNPRNVKRNGRAC